jgi:ribose 5-phosphate isomerase RpiB
VGGTGVGILIRANRQKGIRAAILYSVEVAKWLKNIIMQILLFLVEEQ